MFSYLPGIDIDLVDSGCDTGQGNMKEKEACSSEVTVACSIRGSFYGRASAELDLELYLMFYRTVP